MDKQIGADETDSSAHYAQNYAKQRHIAEIEDGLKDSRHSRNKLINILFCRENLVARYGRSETLVNHIAFFRKKGKLPIVKI